MSASKSIGGNLGLRGRGGDRAHPVQEAVGAWAFGINLRGLAGGQADDLTHTDNPAETTQHDYTAHTQAQTTELTDQPENVAAGLTAKLLRSLDVPERFKSPTR